MIKIQYASDLHLEFAENGSFIKHHPLQVNGDVLILAGDIGYIGDENYSKHPFWDWAADNYEMVVVIPGNHESTRCTKWIICTTDGTWKYGLMFCVITTRLLNCQMIQN